MQSYKKVSKTRNFYLFLLFIILKNLMVCKKATTALFDVNILAVSRLSHRLIVYLG